MRFAIGEVIPDVVPIVRCPESKALARLNSVTPQYLQQKVTNRLQKIQ